MSQKRLMFRWTTPQNLVAILLFIIIASILELVAISITVSSTPDPTAIILPYLGIPLSPLYHLLPLAVVFTLSTSFTYLTTQTATISGEIRKSGTQAPLRTRRKSSRLKPLRDRYKMVKKYAQKIRRTLARTRLFAYGEREATLAKAIVRNALAITITFIFVILLVTFAAFPALVPTTTNNLLRSNLALRSFINTTTKISEILANGIPPIAVIATTLQNAMVSVAPSFRNSLEGTASIITRGLVALTPIQKYIIIQNSASWIVAIMALLYGQYAKSRRYKR